MGAPRTTPGAAAAAPAGAQTTAPPAQVTSPPQGQASTPGDPAPADPAPVDPPQPEGKDEDAPVVEDQPPLGRYLSRLSIHGAHDNGKPWPAPGEVVELSLDTATAYLAAGYITELPPETPDGQDAPSTSVPAGRRSVRAEK